VDFLFFVSENLNGIILHEKLGLTFSITVPIIYLKASRMRVHLFSQASLTKANMNDPKLRCVLVSITVFLEA